GEDGIVASAPALEELHRPLVFSGGGKRLERTQVPPLAGLGVRLARVEPIQSGFEFADHAFTSVRSPILPQAPRHYDRRRLTQNAPKATAMSSRKRHRHTLDTVRSLRVTAVVASRRYMFEANA